jgi:colicin import membrane protein
MHELIVVENLTPAQVFTDKGADSIIDQIEKEARAAPIDISTEAGRKECASIAYKIALSKTFLDDMGKDLVAEWKTKSSKVDAERRKIRDRLDVLKDEIRKPLTDFENTKKARIVTHENQIATIQAFGTLTSGSVHEINTNLEAISTIMQRDWEEFGKRATEVADATRARLQSQLTARQKYEADQAELHRLRDEQAKREQAEREDRIRREAAEKAQRDAEAAIAASKAREEAAQRAAEQAKLDAERQAKQVAEAAEKATKEAAARAEREAQEAAARAEHEKQAAIDAERARAAKQKSDEEEAAAKREADTKHRGKINREALAAIAIAGGISEDAAKQIVEALARGAIPHVTIRY